MEIVEQLRSRINAYISANNREWSGCALNIDKMEYQNAIHLVVAIERKCNSCLGNLDVISIGVRSSKLAGLGGAVGTPHCFHAESEADFGGP